MMGVCVCERVQTINCEFQLEDCGRMVNIRQCCVESRRWINFHCQTQSINQNVLTPGWLCPFSLPSND
jgi:hypothetical protein